MNKKKNIDPIEETLRLIYLENANNASIDEASNSLSIVMDAKYDFQISPEKKEVMVNGIIKSASVMSFGELLNKTIKSKGQDANSIALEAKIPVTVLDQLRSDEVFANNIPVMFIKSLLHKLNLSFKEAEIAILKTFELLKSQVVLEKLNVSTQPTYRKGYYSSRETATWAGNTGPGKDLFESEDALKKYLGRLEELMSK